ncbi:hypothetical protein BCV72DRAFT_233149 [Rhizopus microsporus var. microsporus]|uniref:Uncharacterized protein n=2 Tax=Rhizopus microsporus TaxID=58291 RepID=A0A2G4SYF2_RHIZD|nr:uncharacterized protein RHIMIDRAFT_280473 [Rhizopus microsporus ATCC 52813]ORE03372.1 hypothetical protein BCV72DRAFT_233149 [Rhizopus microsporus var. microsporus]PHZ13792.1 hypothetical protein RHIMIDRAFT_280473 [Rhizopus microsporus ATCC 52813]
MANYEDTLTCIELKKIINIHKRLLWCLDRLDVSFQLGEISPLGMQAAMVFIRIDQEQTIHKSIKLLIVVGLHTPDFVVHHHGSINCDYPYRKRPEAACKRRKRKRIFQISRI